MCGIALLGMVVIKLRMGLARWMGAIKLGMGIAMFATLVTEVATSFITSIPYE